ncbi:acyltransferase family protein [Spirosoma sp. HMF3257]|uniref:Acyltransferase n=2 Tax=Spirosoma telluris TaxID=2183553 RepID=A0A327NSH1_9BACT|nr:acyltransferase family protein [Spirosoma telluris]RAI78227.1 acyltransferase [Spirosoma telluris]
MPQLDALRTFAVLLVIIFHWFPTGEGINRLPNGTIGVVIFFVLSGFLITRILLQNRDLIQTGDYSLKESYRNFFIRRVLRLFPLYYLALTFVLIVLPEASDIDQHPFYYYFYGYNFLLQKTGNWADTLSPFWTLAVEEQLYLIWPWIVLLTPKNTFRWVIITMIISGIAFRAYEYTQGNLDGILTPACFDTFGAGAMWAYIVVDYRDSIDAFLKKLSITAGLALLGFLALLLLPGDHLLTVLFQRTLISVVALFMIGRASLGVQGLLGKILNNPVIQYFGRISYGLYVFHMIVPGYTIALLSDLSNRIHRPLMLGYWSHRFVSLIILLSVASLSWYLIEKPFLSLKRYFVQKRIGQLVS